MNSYRKLRTDGRTVGRADKRRDRQRSIHMTLRLRGSNRTW